MSKAGSSREWNWHPDLPVAVNPAFSWPPQPIATVRWFVDNWLPLSQYLLFTLMAIATWACIQPPLAETRWLHWNWIVQIWLTNLILMILFAQGLHVWFYGRNKQAGEYKYNRRGLVRNIQAFLFNDQYWDNLFHSLVSA